MFMQMCIDFLPNEILSNEILSNEILPNEILSNEILCGKYDFDFSPITIASNKIHLNHVGFFLIKVKQSKYVFPLLKSSPKTIYSLEENFYFTSYLFTAS